MHNEHVIAYYKYRSYLTWHEWFNNPLESVCAKLFKRMVNKHIREQKKAHEIRA